MPEAGEALRQFLPLGPEAMIAGEMPGNPEAVDVPSRGVLNPQAVRIARPGESAFWGERIMETIGENIVEMREMIHTILNPPPAWIRGWQTEAEHVLAMAHSAKDDHDMDKLRMLNEEARRLVETRKAKLAKS